MVGLFILLEATCQADTNICDFGNVNDDTSPTFTKTTLAKLKYSTEYTIDVCTPNCGTGFKFFSTTKTTPASPFVVDLLLCSSADVSRDGNINSIDQLIVSRNYTPTYPYNIQYDVNRDGKVNSTDLLIVSQYFNKQCAKPTQMMVTPSVSCSDVPYTVAFGWQGKGYAWSLDVSGDSTFPAGYSSRSINSLSGLFAPSGFSPGIQFNPGVENKYYWRIWNGNKFFYPVSPNNSFSLSKCPALSNEFPSGWPTPNGKVTQGPNGGNHVGDVANAIDITNNGVVTPILATIDGNVVDVCSVGSTCQFGPSLGNAIKIANPKHPSNFVIFGHLKDAPQLVIGESVLNRQQLGIMGSSGSSSTGVHLHYEFRNMTINDYLPIRVPNGCDELVGSGCGVGW